MRKAMLAALVLGCTLFGQARAQEHYTEGPVWEMTYYRFKDDKGNAYLKWLRQAWLPRMAEFKKQGLILDYKVFFSTSRRDAKDWDIAFGTLYPSYAKALDYSAADEDKSKAIVAKQMKTADEAKQREMMAPRLDWREFVGSEYVREVTLKPLP
jgi:hypothetical protein